MYSFSNKLFKNIINRNKPRKSSISLRRSTISEIIFNTHKSSSINNYKNKTSYENTTKPTKIYSYNYNNKSNPTLYPYAYKNYKTKKNLIFPLNKNKKNKISVENNIIINTNGINKTCEKYDFKKLKKIKNYHQCQTELKKEEQKSDKICLLPNKLKVRNFNLKTSKAIDYLDLNKNINFFIIENRIPKYKKTKKIKSISPKIKEIKKSRSALSLKKIKNFQEIYPTILNIEGHRNIKFLSELDVEERKKKKMEREPSAFFKQNLEFKKKMLKEKWKAEEYAKVNLSNMAYRRQLQILSMKLYKNEISRLKKKISFKFNLDLPLYNLFLNFD